MPTGFVLTHLTQLFCLLFAALPVAAQSGNCTKAFAAPLNSGGTVAMTLRAGEIEVVGAKTNGLRVTCDIRDKRDQAEVKISLAAGRLRVSGGPNKGVRYRIEVPEQTGITINATAGNMEIRGIAGDKDVELRAGNLTMDVGKATDYKVARASVTAGNLTAPAFDSQKDGLFRSFRKEYPGGRYRLRVELTAGNLTLR